MARMSMTIATNVLFLIEPSMDEDVTAETEFSSATKWREGNRKYIKPPLPWILITPTHSPMITCSITVIASLLLGLQEKFPESLCLAAGMIKEATWNRNSVSYTSSHVCTGNHNEADSPCSGCPPRPTASASRTGYRRITAPIQSTRWRTKAAPAPLGLHSEWPPYCQSSRTYSAPRLIPSGALQRGTW